MGGRLLRGVTAMVMLLANGCGSLGVRERTDVPSAPIRGPALPAPTVFTPGREALDAESGAWVEETLASLTLEQKVGQMTYPRSNGLFLNESDAEV